MNLSKELRWELENQTATAQDGFPSHNLRRLILNGVLRLKLGDKPRGTYFQNNYSDTEKIKIDYFRDAGDIGRNIAQNYLAGKILLEPDHFLREVLNAGMQYLGESMARGYAYQIYPELRELQLTGKKGFELPVEEMERRKNMRFGFTVETDRDIYDLGPVMPMDMPAGSNVFYDDICERHIETFVFDSIEAADVAHWNWETFIRHESPCPPVKYAVCIEVSDLDETTVSTVVHADLFEKSRSEFSPEGSAVEWIICDSVGEAETLREEKLKERSKESSEVPAPIPMPEKSVEKAHGKKHSKAPEFPAAGHKRSGNKNISISK